ncbi:uncharacterized protein TRAVEDRAFT_41107 [Trametes versicolor FP-101664 SS1]|uniref:Uncharacterized protein n=1 Tax=Trametes versicolor (strain FP-101664) TaxID=717944 RepID=R7S658_TRAVS|nr:uncharacterized protein TRAVEDRAFT_41107 [Trametes versicolor FP-101664 SS1]EIW51236.1 hypothetical protein TRAVEDRAFT_41107 [Trametes versicolor FP-101664 SS1]
MLPSLLFRGIFPILLLFVLIPMLAVAPPYGFFYLYNLTTRLDPSHPHMKDAAASVHQSANLILCVFGHLAWYPRICRKDPSSMNSSDEAAPRCERLVELVVRRAVLYEDIVRELSLIAPAGYLASLEPVIDDLIALDDHVMLHEEGRLEVLGVGDIELLLQSQTLCRLVGQAAYEIFLHMDLGLFRMLMLHSAMSERLLLTRLGTMRRAELDVDVGTFVAVFANTTTSSLIHIHDQVRRAATIASSLTATIQTLAARKDFDRLCPVSTSSSLLVCDTFSAVLQGFAQVRMVSTALAELDEILETATADLGQLSEAFIPSKCSIWLSEKIVEDDTGAILRTSDRMRAMLDAAMPGIRE